MSPAPIPGPDESVEDMHAYAAADYASNPGAREERTECRDLPPRSHFTVDNPNPARY